MKTIGNAFGWLAIILYLVPGIPAALLTTFIHNLVLGPRPHDPYHMNDGIGNLAISAIYFSIAEWLTVLTCLGVHYGALWPTSTGLAMLVHFLWWWQD